MLQLCAHNLLVAFLMITPIRLYTSRPTIFEISLYLSLLLYGESKGVGKNSEKVVCRGSENLPTNMIYPHAQQRPLS